MTNTPNCYTHSDTDGRYFWL